MNQSYACIFVNFAFSFFYFLTFYYESSNLRLETVRNVTNNQSNNAKDSFNLIQHQRQENLDKFCRRDLGTKAFSGRIAMPGKFVTFHSSTTNTSSSSSHWLFWCPVLKAASSNWFYRFHKYLKSISGNFGQVCSVGRSQSSPNAREG